MGVALAGAVTRNKAVDDAAGDIPFEFPEGPAQLVAKQRMRNIVRSVRFIQKKFDFLMRS